MAQRATAAGARVYQILDREPRIVAKPGAGAAAAGLGPRRAARRVAGVRPGPRRARRCTTSRSTWPPGTTVALVGSTGSGKTTLVNLIPRLYDTTAGAVLVDGTDVRDVDPASLRAQIAIVDDDPFLFSDTVRGEHRLRPRRREREEIETAARRAQAHDFIERLPDGYATRVGERGLTLSGGQRQRLAIARAFLADPRILVLDDATSSVDASTEQEIKQALREVMAGRTTFVIAHRLSTISLADLIVVLEDGRLVAEGDHAALLEQSELYREIVEKGLPDQVFLNRVDPEREVAGL